MAWVLLVTLLGALVIALGLVARRAELFRSRSVVDERRVAVSEGSAKARLQYPHIDLSRCIGCGSCVAACPEEGVLGMVHGQAAVLHGSRCVGHARCAVECPVGAIAVTLGDLSERDDIPALLPNFESTQTPGLFLAGEVTGLALVRTAISHGTAIANEVARRCRDERTPDELLDLCIVGAGPAGLAASLEAKRQGLRFKTLEREQIGGAVSQYPRKKLVMTQPVELPLHGKLARTAYSKEELMELWTEVASREELPIECGKTFQRVERLPNGILRVVADDTIVDARHVCLALGRRGTPRKLGVPGEDKPKVAYSLLDAQSHAHSRILVVGGGDSAVEAAMGLAEQPGNRVTLSYRGANFSRIKARNAVRLPEVEQEGRLEVLLRSNVKRIADDSVLLDVEEDGKKREVWLENDEVFVFAGGTPPFEQLKASGVSFDPADRPAQETLAEQGSGLLPALAAATLLGGLTLAWALFERNYYGAGTAERVALPEHAWLRPSSGLGLVLGILAVLLIATNLTYLVRRSPRIRFELGSLKAWMTSHVVTGLVAFLLATLHAGLAPKHTVGGHAFWGLAILVVTGAIGRYFYAFVPRAANGRELAFDEVRTELARLSSRWDGTNRAFGERVRERVEGLVTRSAWSGSWFARIRALFDSQIELRRVVVSIVLEGRREGVPQSEVREVVELAKRAHRTALMASHYGEVRAILGSWRWFHRWIALLMVLLVVVHVVAAIQYVDFGWGGGR
ncbi:MAG: NAD(P)-binding domain-containing protein [Planctomycetota bacterium]